MDNDFNWKLASNSQLKEECERLQEVFSKKQDEMRQHVDAIDLLNNEMIKISEEYNNIKSIYDKRIGKSS